MWFEREDWQLFRTIETLSQKAGVPKNKLAILVAKELADNALDACGSCEIGILDNNGFYIKDTGEGLDNVETLFSINRPLTSTKLFRLPQRGALGNGLRVVAGVVLATDGKLMVSTKGKTYSLIPQYDGTTVKRYLGEYDKQGTRIDICLGEAAGKVNLAWASDAKMFARGDYYKGKTSAYWYTFEAFYELCMASRDLTVLELVSYFDGCTGQKAGMISADFKGRYANTITELEASAILSNLRSFSKLVKAGRLGNIGELIGFQYVKKAIDKAIILRSGKSRLHAEIPAIIEVWTKPSDHTTIIASVNKTPITGSVRAYHTKSLLDIYGCGLSFGNINIGKEKMQIVINVITPYMPITTDGKEPDFSQLGDNIRYTLEKAIRKTKKINRNSFCNISNCDNKTQKNIILNNLQSAVNKASGNDKYRFSHRQLYYAVRPYVIDELGKELEYSYFGKIITEYESQNNRIPGMYFDDRGTIYHPHLGREIPLGTITVEKYSRPEWTFNKVLYCEKEGFFPMLINAKWPEKHDCVLLTSKGYASRAAKDLIDLIGETNEEVTFYCIHDADASGTMIYETLLKETSARGKRKVHIVNLGLNPWEAQEMSLQAEKASHTKKSSVSQYVYEYDKTNGTNWVNWLQRNRYELNAMTTPQFIEWLDWKMSEENSEKLIPPDEVLIDELQSNVESELKALLTDKILNEAKIDEKVSAAYCELESLIQEQEDFIDETVTAELQKDPTEYWKIPVQDIAKRLVQVAV